MNSEMTLLMLLTNVGATLFMVGVIWFVQLVHYPLFARVNSEQFGNYHAAHVRATTWVVGPPMLVEAATSLILALAPPARELANACWAGASLVLVIWLSTFMLQVPKHNRLARGFDQATQHALVHGNWIRTIGWSLRGVLCLILLWFALAGAANQSGQP